MSEIHNDLLAPTLAGGRPTWYGPFSNLPTDERELLSSVAAGYAEAVATADFAEKVQLADRLFGLNDDRFDEAANYLRAEGLRIQADFEVDESRARRLRRDALESYEIGLEADPGSVRCNRGRGRILEVTGEPDQALNVLQGAYHAASLANSDRPDDGGPAHEVIRSTRHAIACWGALALESPASRAATEHQKRIWTGRIYESWEHHRVYLGKFVVEPRWGLIEQFMGYTMLSKGAAAAGEQLLAQSLAQGALRSRLEMEPTLWPIPSVLWGNLKWWLVTARHAWAGRPAEMRVIETLALSAIDDVATHGDIIDMCDVLGVWVDHWLRSPA